MEKKVVYVPAEINDGFDVVYIEELTMWIKPQQLFILTEEEMQQVIIVWKDGTYKLVESKSAWEYQADEDYLTTIEFNLL